MQKKEQSTREGAGRKVYDLGDGSVLKVPQALLKKKNVRFTTKTSLSLVCGNRRITISSSGKYLNGLLKRIM